MSDKFEALCEIIETLIVVQAGISINQETYDKLMEKLDEIKEES